MRPWIAVLVVALSSVVSPATAQSDTNDTFAWSEISCSAQDGRIVRGRVLDSKDVPPALAWVVFPEYQCGTRTDSLGNYVATGVPRDASEMLMTVFFHGRFQHPLASPRDTVIDQVVEAREVRVRDWSRYGARPESPDSVDGIAGCYWLGHDSRAFPDIVELRNDGSVVMDTVTTATWWRIREGGDSIRVSRKGQGFGFLHNWGFDMDLPEPQEWSSVPTLFWTVTDVLDIVPTEWDSFVTRVECRPGEALSN